MSSNPPRPKSRRTRLRITEIELAPSTSNRQISAKVLADEQVVCELPWIKSGRLLRWARLIVHDGSDDSKVILEVCEKHSIRDRRFRSSAYIISSVQQLTEITVGFVDPAWKATFRLLTPAAAEQSFASGIAKLRELEATPSALDRLGGARPIFAAMLQFGSEISELHPAAKVVFMICTKAWEKLEEQEQNNENMRELLDGLSGILEFVQLLKKHARTEELQGTITRFLSLVEDVSIFAAEQAQSASNRVRTLRGLLDSKDHEKGKQLLTRFERLRAELDIGIGVETHKQVHAIEQKVNMADLVGLLSQLQPVTPSGYDPSRACQEGTREGIISNILSWTKQDTASECVLWVHGQAGIGKSSIATSICQQLANQKVLAASFFCKRDDPSLRDPLRLINSIAYGLAARYAPYGEAVAASIQEDRELCTAHMGVRYDGLIKKPLQSLADSLMDRPLIILIDALDECGTYDTRRNLLMHLSDMSQLVPWLRLIVTSRPDGDIQDFFQGRSKSHISFRNVHSFDASDDIRAYIHKELGHIARRHQWPENSIEQLCQKAGGVFIWAATVKNYLTGFRGSTVPRLQKVLSDQQSTISDHLDALYRSVILAGMRHTDEDQMANFRQCIGTIVIASTHQPLSVSSLGSLLSEQIDVIALEDVVKNLDAVLHVDNSLGGVVRFYHPSFADYAIDPSRSGDLYVSPVERNSELAMGCLKTMERELRFNICELETSELFNNQVPNLTERVKSKISDQLGYACTYWISHLLEIPKGTLKSEVEAMINSPRVLYWLEVLSLLGKVETGLQGLLKLQEWLPESEEVLMGSVEDMYRFISAFYEPISSSAPHIYVSALALAPSSALVVQRLRSSFPNSVIVTHGGDMDWPRWLRSLVHPEGVLSLAVSSDGRFLVTGCWDGAVRIWDVRSGSAIGEPLSANSGFVRCVAASSDGSCIVAGYFGRVLLFWDTKTGATIGEPLIGHSDVVLCVAFSPDERLIVSGSVDKTIRLWDTETHAAVGEPLVEHSDDIESVAFSPDGMYIISSFSSGMVRIWVTATMDMASELLVAEAYTLKCAMFLSHGRHIVYGSSVGLGTLQWDPNKGTIVGEPLLKHSSRVSCLAVSPDGHHVVFATYDSTVHIWDLEMGATVGEPLTGHFDAVMSVSFLPDGRRIASASADKTVRLWDTRPRSRAAVIEPLHGHSGIVASVAFSPDGTRIVSGSHDKTICLWDAKTGAGVGQPLDNHTDAVASVAYSPDGNLIVSGSFDKTLRIWDAQTGITVGEPLIIHSHTVDSVIFSPDGTRIASGSRDGTVAVTSLSPDLQHVASKPEIKAPTWRTEINDTRSDQPPGQLTRVNSVTFSPDGRHVVSGCDDGTIHMWDANTGAAVGDPLVGHSFRVACVAFSPDGVYIVSGSADTTMRRWNASLGTPVGEPLVGHSGSVVAVGFSPNGNIIVSGSDDKTVRLWDCNTGVAIGDPFMGHTSNVTSVVFSPDNNSIASGSWDGSVRVWTVNPRLMTEVSHTVDPSYFQKPILTNATASWPSHTYALPAHPDCPGWVSLDGESLLLWLPTHYQREYSPHTLYTISSEPSHSLIRLDFSMFAHGPSWESIASNGVRKYSV